MKILKFKKLDKLLILFLVGVIGVFSGLFSLSTPSFVNENNYNLALINPNFSVIHTAQGYYNDSQHDFYEATYCYPIPSNMEPDQMYDLKNVTWDGNYQINLSVYGILKASDGNMTADPFELHFGLIMDITYTIVIGTYYDDDNDEIRAYIEKINWQPYVTWSYWNGSGWVDSRSKMNNAGDTNWDVCDNNPDDSSMISIKIPGGTGFNTSVFFYGKSRIHLQSGYAEDFIPIGPCEQQMELESLLILQALTQEPESTAIPSYPPMMISITLMIIISIIWISLKKKSIDYN